MEAKKPRILIFGAGDTSSAKVELRKKRINPNYGVTFTSLKNQIFTIMQYTLTQSLIGLRKAEPSMSVFFSYQTTFLEKTN